MNNNKISGIYQIKNKVNNKIYIGHSSNIFTRWYFHVDNLFKNIHPNKKLQEDFNHYELHSLSFSILELIDGKSNLIKREQYYINKLNIDENYNLVNSISVTNKRSLSMPDKFMDYIKTRWLIPKNITKDKLRQYLIYKKVDKEEIVKLAIKYNILKEYPSRITFAKVIKEMQNNLGYSIQTRRCKINKKQYTCKLIVDLPKH